MRTFELKKRKGIESSLYAIALVENPAIEVGFVALTSDNIRTSKIKLSEDKMMLYTPLLIPNQKIFRKDESTGEEYQIYFSKETCEEVFHDFMKANLSGEFNSEHQENKPLSNINVVEGWIVKDSESGDHLKLGFQGLPEGTPMVAIDLSNNPEEWAKCKAGTYKGVSIEGLFDDYEVQFNSNQNIMSKETATVLEKAVTKLGALVTKLTEPTTKLASAELADGAGTIYFEGDLGEATMVFMDEAMETAAEDGEYKLANGSTVTVEGGSVATIVEMEQEQEFNSEEVSAALEQSAQIQEKIVEKVEANEGELAELKAENTKLSNQLTELTKKVTKLAKSPAAKSVTKLTQNNQGEEFKGINKFFNKG